MSSLPVKPELGPTLPELAGPRWRRTPKPVRIALMALAALLVVLAAVTAIGGNPVAADETPVVVEEGGAPFNLRYGEGLERVEPGPGELLALDDARTGRFLQSFAVTPLDLGTYRGIPAGAYPAAAERVKDELARRFDGFRLVEEGRMRINEAPAYEVVFAARTDDGRALYGRWVMIVPLTEPPTPQRRGVTLQLLGTFAAGIPNVTSIGDVGRMKLPLRSFRFGTEAP